MSENKEKDNKVLLLYSTSGCHLCDLAKGLIDEAQPAQSFTLKIIDIANELIRLSGYEPELDITIEFTGTRPGEKKIEELSLPSEKLDKTKHDKIKMKEKNKRRRRRRKKIKTRRSKDNTKRTTTR